MSHVLAGSTETRDYELLVRWLEEGSGWKSENVPLTGVTFAAAGREGERRGRELDAKYPGPYDWSIKLFDAPRGEYGAYWELFHGRV